MNEIKPPKTVCTFKQKYYFLNENSTASNYTNIATF